MKIIKKNILGVDIGGSHISAAVVDSESFQILPGTYYQAGLDNKAKKDILLQVWSETIAQAMKASPGTGFSGIGIAMPGPFDYPSGKAMFTGNDKYDALYEVNVREELSRLLKYPAEDIHFYNDAASFAVGSALKHEVLNKQLIAITLGTGFGASFLRDEVPVMVGPGVPENGCLWDKVYQEGIADDYFSTRWFLRKNQAQHGKDYKGVKELIECPSGNSKELFREFNNNLTEFLAPFIDDFEAEVLLVGGNISRAQQLFLEPLRTALTRNRKLRLIGIENTDACNILGASRLMDTNYWAQQPTPKAFF